MKLALGTAQFGMDYGVTNRRGKVPREEAAAIIRMAREAGTRTLDTAAEYGDCEWMLGDIGVGDFQVVSKLPAMRQGTASVHGWMAKCAVDSLAKLKIDQLDGLLLHRPRQLLEAWGDEIYEGLLHLKSAGLVRKIGISVYTPGDLDEIWPRYPFDLVQAPFNLFDNRLRESGWLARLDTEQVEIHVRSVFLQGVLLLPLGERLPKFDRWASQFARYDAWLEAHGRSRLDACLGYVTSIPEIDRVIVGVETAEQFRDILWASSADAPPFPESLASSDPELLNPVAWSSL